MRCNDSDDLPTSTANQKLDPSNSPSRGAVTNQEIAQPHKVGIGGFAVRSYGSLALLRIKYGTELRFLPRKGGYEGYDGLFLISVGASRLAHVIQYVSHFW